MSWIEHDRTVKWKQRLLDIAFSTCRGTDRNAIREAVHGIYRATGSPPPSKVVLTASPIESLKADAEFRKSLNKGARPESLSWKIRAYVHNLLSIKRREALRALSSDEEAKAAVDLLAKNLLASVYAVQRVTGDAVYSHCSAIAEIDRADRFCLYGAHDPEIMLLLFYDAIKPQKVERLLIDSLRLYAENASWMIAYTDVCFVSLKPEEVHYRDLLNGRRVLHRDGGVALRFKDGFGLK